MLAKTITKSITVFLLSFMLAFSLSATHNIGGEITYTCIGGNDYEITLTSYYDCVSSSNPLILNILPLDIYSSNCRTGFVASLDLFSSTEISDICIAESQNTYCNGGTFPSTIKAIHKGIISFPANCDDWSIVSNSMYGRMTMTNTIDFSSTNIYLAATLDNLNVSCNNSPTFTEDPVLIICGNQPFTYNLGVLESDNDSLAFSLVAPLEDANTSLPYALGFSATYPLATNPPNNFNFDSQTGEMSFIPAGAQVGIVSVLVEEFRNGQKIGSTFRDIYIRVINCLNQGMTIAPPSNISSGVAQNGNDFTTCISNNVSFDIVVTNLDSIGIPVISSDLSTLPGATLTTTGTNPYTVNFNWTPSNSGIYPFTIKYSDDYCPIPNVQVLNYSIVVSGVEAHATTGLNCTGVIQSIPLVSTLNDFSGGGTYAWTPSTGLNDPNIANPTASISQPMTYTVSYTENACTVNATVTVDYNPNAAALVATAQDQLACSGVAENIQLSVTHLSNPTGWSYLWSPSTGLNDSSSSNPIATISKPMTYTLNAVKGNCTTSTNVEIETLHQLSLTADATTICLGSSTELYGNYVGNGTSGSCGISVDNCTSTTNFILGDTLNNVPGNTPSPYAGDWEDGRFQMLYNGYELQQKNIQAGLISGLSLNVITKASTQAYHNFTIKMGCVEDTALYDLSNAALQTVYHNTYTTVLGWNHHDFDNAYD